MNKENHSPSNVSRKTDYHPVQKSVHMGQDKEPSLEGGSDNQVAQLGRANKEILAEKNHSHLKKALNSLYWDLEKAECIIKKSMKNIQKIKSNIDFPKELKNE